MTALTIIGAVLGIGAILAVIAGSVAAVVIARYWWL